MASLSLVIREPIGLVLFKSSFIIWLVWYFAVFTRTLKITLVTMPFLEYAATFPGQRQRVSYGR